ncbi:transposase [Acetobacter orientalis]|uniref:Transposase n=1 Tax=Acetobacter orientalis TaxID=146474 RepID=A0A2Z5ZHC5_9PROT|nr:transposase [Acetobacter orientalis]
MIHRLTDGGRPVSDVFMLSERQMERIEPFFPLGMECPRE